jgi:hypothetical protein
VQSGGTLAESLKKKNVKEIIYKSLGLSLLITNIWTIFAFFNYYYEESGMFHGLETLILFIWSCWTVAGFGIIIIPIAFMKKWLSVSQMTFLLTMAISLNTFYLILFLILSFKKLIRVESFIETFLFVNLIIIIASILIIKKIKGTFI